MIGFIIHTYRHRKGRKQYKLSEEVGLTPVALSVVERRGVKGFDRVIQLFEALGYKVELKLTDTETGETFIETITQDTYENHRNVL